MVVLALIGGAGGSAAGFVAGRKWPPGPDWVTHDYDYDLDFGSPFVTGYDRAYEPTKPVDTDGIVITEYHGERVYHPVDACWYLFPQLHSYELDGDDERMTSVRATTQYLLEGAETHQIPADDGPKSTKEHESLWFPYHFEHSPGGLDNGVPWYSGMAQGMMLSHFVRMHEVTKEQEWADIAHLVFNSFRHYRDGRTVNDNPWFVSFIDDGSRRFTTFEEYPSRDPNQISHVVNGNLYAMWGIFDYLRMTEERYARKLLSRGLASLQERFNTYRTPAHSSLYGMTPWSYLTWSNPENYHRGVVSMLHRTADMARAPVFSDQAETLRIDIESSGAAQ